MAFYVFADGTRIYGSGTLTATTRPRRVDLDVTGVDVLELVVTNARDTAFDHASWAAARIYVKNAGVREGNPRRQRRRKGGSPAKWRRRRQGLNTRTRTGLEG